MKEFFSNLWKNQPNTVLGASAGFILLAFFSSISVYKSIIPEPYKVQKIKFTPHMIPSPDGLTTAVVDLRVNFIGRKDRNISAYFSRCLFDSAGQLVRYPNIVK